MGTFRMRCSLKYSEANQHAPWASSPLPTVEAASVCTVVEWGRWRSQSPHPSALSWLSNGACDLGQHSDIWKRVSPRYRSTTPKVAFAFAFRARHAHYQWLASVSAHAAEIYKQSNCLFDSKKITAEASNCKLHFRLDAIYTYFAKAFDSVNQHIDINKLKNFANIRSSKFFHHVAGTELLQGKKTGILGA